jgi:hypothetical protein
MGEKSANQATEELFVSHVGRVIDPELEPEKSGYDPGARSKSDRGDAKQQLDPRGALSDDAQKPVRLRRRWCYQPLRHFALEHEGELSKQVGVGEKPKKNGRGHRVGEISADSNLLEPPEFQQLAEVELQRVLLEDLDSIGKIGGGAAELFRETRVGLDRNHASPGASERKSELTGSSTDLEKRLAGLGCDGNDYPLDVAGIA